MVATLRRLAAATLRDRDRGDAAAHADSEVVLAEEAAIGTIKGRGTAEDMAVTPERGRHMDFVYRVAFENLIVGDQSSGTFGEKHFVAELNRCATLPRLIRSVCGSKIE